MSDFDVDVLTSQMGHMRIGTLVQKPIDIREAQACMVRIDQQTNRNAAVDCVIHSLAATGFLSIEEASEIAPTINSTRKDKGITAEKIQIYLGDNLHKKIEFVPYTIDNHIPSSFQVIKNYLFQNLLLDNATPITYNRFIMTRDKNGNEIKEPVMGHNVVVMNSSRYNDIIIIDTQQNKMNEFNSYFLLDEPKVYKIYLYFQSNLPDTAMDIVPDPLKFTTDGGKHKRKKNSKKSRKSRKSRKTKRRKMKRKN
jgi:hypothetical protein